jgi:hypothetical protein
MKLLKRQQQELRYSVNKKGAKLIIISNVTHRLVEVQMEVEM